MSEDANAPTAELVDGAVALPLFRLRVNHPHEARLYAAASGERLATREFRTGVTGVARFDDGPVSTVRGNFSVPLLTTLFAADNVTTHLAAADDDYQFWDACSAGDDVVVRELLDAGVVDVEYPSEDGRSPLLIAVTEGHTAVARALIAAGAQLEAAYANRAPRAVCDGACSWPWGAVASRKVAADGRKAATNVTHPSTMQ